MKEERDLAEATVEEEEVMAVVVAAGVDTGEVGEEAMVAEEDMVVDMGAEEGEEETEGLNEIADQSPLRRVRK
jgi:hypothetical protein